MISNNKLLWNSFAATVLIALGACAPSSSSEKLASGKLLSIGNEYLVVQGDEHMMFVSVDQADKARLITNLQKGENITILGKKDVDSADAAEKHVSADVYAIVKADGSQIALNH